MERNKWEFEASFYLHQAEKIIKDNISNGNADRHQHSFFPNDWNQADPERRFHVEHPDPESAADRVLGKSSAKGAGKDKFFVERIHDQRDGPIKREVPSRAAFGMRPKGDHGENRDSERPFLMFGKIEDAEQHRKETEDGAGVHRKAGKSPVN